MVLGESGELNSTRGHSQLAPRHATWRTILNDGLFVSSLAVTLLARFER